MNTPSGQTNKTMHQLSPQLLAFLQQPALKQCMAMSAKALYEHTADLPIKMIQSAAGPYLERYFLLEQDGCFAYLHRFVNEDARDEGVHDHPWEMAFSQVLHGGYQQQVNVNDVVPGMALELNEHHIVAGDSNLIAGTRFHKITEVENETWTLFVHSAWCRPWGFLHGDTASGNFRHEIHPSDPNHRWWLQAPLAKDSQREPFINAKLVA